MGTGADWLAANDHPKGPRPEAVRAWVRPRGQTWHRPAPARPAAGESPVERPQHRLIAAGRVSGATVYSPIGRRLGRIAEIAVDEASGEVAFVLLASGGFLGLGERLRRLPWSALAYDAERRGYVVNPIDDHLQDVVSFSDKVAFQNAADRGGWATGA